MTNKKVLVTGGAGYIGSVLVRILLNKGYFVRVIDNLSFGGESLVDVFPNSNFDFVRGDLRNKDDLSKALHGINYVCHLAAIVGDPACNKFSKDAHEINWDGSKNLFNKCVELGVDKFVFASTCSNYGKMSDPESYVVEDLASRIGTYNGRYSWRNAVALGISSLLLVALSALVTDSVALGWSGVTVGVVAGITAVLYVCALKVVSYAILEPLDLLKPNTRSTPPLQTLEEATKVLMSELQGSSSQG